jgi:hypothetical protein
MRLPYDNSVYPVTLTVFHLACDHDPADHTGSVHFCEGDFSIFSRDFHSFNYPILSPQAWSYGIDTASTPGPKVSGILKKAVESEQSRNIFRENLSTVHIFIGLF